MRSSVPLPVIEMIKAASCSRSGFVHGRTNSIVSLCIRLPTQQRGFFTETRCAWGQTGGEFLFLVLVVKANVTRLDEGGWLHAGTPHCREMRNSHDQDASEGEG
jgi:hypothetical protein